MLKFCIQTGESTREKLAIFSVTRKLGYEYTIRKECPVDHIPIGTVEFCESILPIKYSPKDFYPDFLKDHMYREYGLSTFGGVEGYEENSTIKRHRLFLKIAYEWKSDFKSRTVEWNEPIPYGHYYWSHPVEFIQEWRYYIANGQIITTGWYSGNDEDEPAPELGIVFPKDFNAATDFGRLSTGEIALVESHAPFACGWYGEDHEDYVRWQYEAWKGYMNE